MKRKFLNGIIAAAIVAAGAVTSSCNDYSEDALNAMRADNLALITDLQDQLNKLRQELDSRTGINPKFKIENGDLYYSIDGGLNWTYIGRVQGEDGVGTAGPTPDFKIINGDLYYSIDGGTTWIKIGKVQGDNGNDGNDGKTPSFKIEEGILYYSLDGGTTWTSLGKVQGENGNNGDNGKTPTFKIENGDLYYSLDGGTSWIFLGTVQGENGNDGNPGNDGKTPTFKIEEGVLYYSLDGGTTWTSLGNVQGGQGNPGNDGKTPTFKIEGGVLYYSLDGGTTWTSLGNIQGGQGNPGNDGKTPTFKIEEGVLYYSIDGGTNWISLGNVKGADGNDGNDGKTPMFKIEEGVLYYSLDSGTTWTSLGNVQGGQGNPGNDGKTPTFKLEGGVLYYSLDGGTTWTTLGNVQGADGEDGNDGEDGKTPTFKIEEGVLYYSLDNGTTWTSLGKVSANDGKTPYIQDGHWWIGTGADAQDLGPAVGADGNDGKTPYIQDGHWWIGTGADAQDLGPAVGATGFSAYEVYKNNAIAAGQTPMSEEEWLESLKGADGADGVGILSVTMDENGITITLTDGTSTYYAFDASWKCDEEECENAVNVIKEITKAFGLGDGILTTEQLQELGAKITQALDDIQTALKRTEALKERATSISIDGVKNKIFGMIKTPFGIQTNMLYGYYGSINPVNAFQFPSTNPAVYADASVILNNSNVTLNTANTGKGNIFLPEMGEVYYTINPSEVNFAGIDIALSTSTGKACGIELTSAAPMTKDLYMGWTRGASSCGIYQSTAKVTNFNDVEKIEINVEDYLDVVKALKDKNVHASASEIATAMKNSLAAFKTKAYALQIASEDYITTEDGNKHVVRSPLDIQAALIKPVGYEVAAKLPSNIPGNNRAVSFVNRTVKTLVNQLTKNGTINQAKALLDQFNGTLKHIEFGSVAGNEALITVSITALADVNYITPEYGFHNGSFEQIGEVNNEGQVTVKIDYNMYKSDFQKLFDVLNEDVDDINDMLDKANDVVSFGLDLINKLQGSGLENKITGTLDKVVDKVWSAMNKAYHAFEYRFELALFAESNGSFTPMRISATKAPTVSSSFTCYMTNLNLEMLVPAFKKHLVVTDALGATDKAAAIAAVNASINKVYSGDINKVNVSGLKSGVTYEFSYSGLDYAGKQQTRVFYVKCK